MIIDIPLTLVVTLLISLLSLAGIVYIYKFLKKVIIFLTNVPFLSPKSLQDLEKRAKAIDAYNHGDPEPLKKYWDEFYDSETRKEE